MASIHRVTSDFVRQLEGFSLATAEILYRIPDHPLLLQTYIWQDYDRAPDFPVLHRFLAFWEKNLDGRLYAVKVVHERAVGARDITIARSLEHLH